MNHSYLQKTIIISLLAFSASSVQGVNYSIVPIDIPSFHSSADINNNNQITGAARFPEPSATHAAIYDDGILIDLGVPVGYDETPTGTGGLAINDSGQVAGYSSRELYARLVRRATYYDGNVMHEIGVIGNAEWYKESYGYAINNNGEIAGTSGIESSNATHAFYYDGSTMHDLGTIGGPISEGFDINASGMITGSSTINTSGPLIEHAFLYDGSTMHDLGTLGGEHSTGTAINDNGHVTGYSHIIEGSPIRHAFLYDGTTMHDLGTLDGTNTAIPDDINNQGHIVGNCYEWTGTGYRNHQGFFYDGEIMYNLCDLVDCLAEGWCYQYLKPTGINDKGVIFGEGEYCGPNGHQNTFFMITPDPIPAIPDGDINIDGVVNAADVLLATQAASGTRTLNSDQFIHGDVAPFVNNTPNPDGELNAADLSVILRKAMGLITF